MNIVRQLYNKIASAIHWYINLYRGRKWYVKTAVGVMSFIVSIFIWLGMIDINFLWLFGKTPGFSSIMQPPTFEASEIYSADGVLIGKYYKENRTPVEFHEVSQDFWKALIDTEDERFYSHYGIDIQGVGGAIKDAITRRGKRGASTITQQLAKNMFHMRGQQSRGILTRIPGLRMLVTKSKEWIIATKLEIVYDKKAILTMYANTVDFGNNAYGIKTAAKTYFNTTPAELNTQQAAMLVGMLKGTTYYSPTLHPDRALERRNVVLNNMVEHGDLSTQALDSLSKKPLDLDIYKEEREYGQIDYFREAIIAHLQEWTEDNGYDLYSSGLKIYTTVDSRMQKYAEQAASAQMQQIQQNFNSHWSGQEPWRDERGKLIPHFIEDIAKRQPFYKTLEQKYNGNEDSIRYYLNKPHKVRLFDYSKGAIYKEMSSLDSIRYMVKYMHCAMVAMEPQTGAVKAWVGDIDFSSWQYDKVTAMRQPGSTFKLFVYTEAMNQGMVPCDKRCDEAITIETFDNKTGKTISWSPTNASGRFSGDSLTLKMAFAKSVNSIAVRLGQELGIRNIIKTAEDMGIKSKLEDEPSLVLGSSDVNLLEMVNSYCTIANDGKHIDPVLVTSITDKNGREIYHCSTKTHKVIPYKSAFLMQEILKAGVNEAGGTSQSLRNYITTDTDWGGKTGTSNNHSDAWFIGVSPRLVVGAWVGGEYRCIHFRTGALGQGARTALPICGSFLQKVFHDRAFAGYHTRWAIPSDLEIDPSMFECVDFYVETDSIPDSLSIDEDKWDMDIREPEEQLIDTIL